MIKEFPCIHCGRNLLADQLLDARDFEYAVFLYGIFFLQGKDDGFVGTTCPSCLQTMHAHLDKDDFDHFLDMLHIFSFRGLKFLELFRYFSPFVSAPANNPELLKNITHEYSTVFDNDIYEIERDMPSYIYENQANLYQTYIAGTMQAMDGTAPVIGSFFYNMWATYDQVIELVEIENKTGMRMFPRYVLKNEMLNAVENFCWKYRLEKTYKLNPLVQAILYEQKIAGNKLVPPALRDKTLELIEKEAEISPSCLINEFLERQLIVLTKDVDKASSFHKILVSDPEPYNVSLNRDITITGLWKRGNPFRKIDRKRPYFKEAYRCENDKFISQVNQNNLHTSIPKEYAQEFLLQSADNFIDNYLHHKERTLKKAAWSYANLWKIQQEFFGNYKKAVSDGKRREVKFAFFNAGGTWEIIFNGKRITGLKNNGFMFIHFLVCHESKSFTHWDLNCLDKGTVLEGPQQYTEDTQNMDGTDVFEYIDIDGKKKKKRGQYKINQDRIGNAITRAIEKLEKMGKKEGNKHYKNAAKHFRASIKGRYGNKITYRSSEKKIVWHT